MQELLVYQFEFEFYFFHEKKLESILYEW